VPLALALEEMLREEGGQGDRHSQRAERDPDGVDGEPDDGDERGHGDARDQQTSGTPNR
jgi:hypothetical protein